MLDVNKFVPQKNSNYIPHGNFKDVETIIQSRLFFPIYITGETSNGKTEMVKQIHAKHNIPMIRVNIDASVDGEALIGRQTLVDGNISVVYGPALLAMKHGMTLYLDEISAGHPNAILCLQSILEGNPYYFRYTDELIFPSPGFNVIATDNTKGQGSTSGKYNGTHVLNESFLERFAVTFEQEYPEDKVEAAIAKQLMVSLGCYGEDIHRELLKWTSIIRLTYRQGGISTMITTRRLKHIIEAYAIYRDMHKAIKYCVSRFDATTRDSLIAFWSKITTQNHPI